MVVKNSGIKLEDKLSNYNGTIMDGELIFLPKKNRHMFLVFDCLFNGSTDLRKNPKLMDRLKEADKIIQKCFVFDTQKNFTFSDYKSRTSEFNLNDVIDFHEGQMRDYMDALNNDIDIEKRYPLIRRKYFIDVVGAKPWEIFAYASSMYKKYTESQDIKCPYLLDGLIFQPLDQEYITSTRDSKYLDYKWKPPHHNSIDFFIEFEKDKDSGKILTVYDNSNDGYIRNKPYKICNLHVGYRSKIGEQPVLFRQEEELYMAYLFLTDGEVRDLEGNILQDKTVVEFYYNSDPAIEDKFRWVPIKIRNDKTESVIKFRKRYGNYIDVANKVWRSIIKPVLISDFEELAKGNNTYEKKMADMRSKISHELIVSTAKENVYYQVKGYLAKPMRQFHNWIKSIIIYTYCHLMYEHEQAQTILDISCGRGGDLLKFYYAKCKSYVGIDIDKEGLISAVDGAESRYAQMRKTHPNFPEMTFIQADAGALFNVADQTRVFGGMSDDNARKMNKFFPVEQNNKVKFDRVNCQFAMHYFLKNDETWSNFKTNLNNHLKAGGFFMTTTFDADRINELLKDKETYTVHYTTDKGEKKILFELKRYQEFKEKPFKPGNAIDVHAAWMFKEGQYQTEYLVDKDFIVADLYKDCDLELVDTDLFDNQYEIHKDYFLNYAKYDDNSETRQFLLKVAGFYEHNEINGGCFKYTRLERYYVFRKRDNINKNINININKNKNINKKVHKGGSIDNIINAKDTIIAPMENKDYTYNESLYHLMRTHKFIPKNVSFNEFAGDFNLVDSDNDLTNDKISEINKKMIIEHQVGKKDTIKKETVLEGINTIIIEKDCNDMYDVDKISGSIKSDKSIILVKEGNMFSPLYKKYKNKKTYTGIFNNDDTIIEELIQNI
jgi:hypothetical protein